MFVWWNNDSNEEEKDNWDTKRLQKFKVSLQSDRQMSVVVVEVFEYCTLFKKKKQYLSLGLFFIISFFGLLFLFDAATCGIFFQIEEIPQGHALE